MDGFSSGFSINGFEFSVWCSPCSPSGHFVSEEGVGQDHAVFSVLVHVFNFYIDVLKLWLAPTRS